VYQISSPHCPDRTTSANTGTTECGQLLEFDITPTEKKSLTTESYSKFEDEVDFIVEEKKSPLYIPKLFQSIWYLSVLKCIQSTVKLCGNYLSSDDVSFITLFVQLSLQHHVYKHLQRVFFLHKERPIFVAMDTARRVALLIAHIR
jgi:hypothetical protein